MWTLTGFWICSNKNERNKNKGSHQALTVTMYWLPANSAVYRPAYLSVDNGIVARQTNTFVPKRQMLKYLGVKWYYVFKLLKTEFLYLVEKLNCHGVIGQRKQVTVSSRQLGRVGWVARRDLSALSVWVQVWEEGQATGSQVLPGQ